MNTSYGRDLDLNLLRVFAVVAETGSVTRAAEQLYLTQPAISAALRRLTTAVGAPLFVRQGRGLRPTSRGERLMLRVRTHLRALVDAALAPASFEPGSSERTVRLGLADSAEMWLLPALLGKLGELAPRMRVISVPVQFRTVGALLATGQLDAAVTVADELPAGVRRQELFWGNFTCLHDPRKVRLPRRLTQAAYFAAEHVVVSYNGDLRGIVEDVIQKQRKVRCSVASFARVGALVDGGPLLATVPILIARQIRQVRPHLRMTRLPFSFPGAPSELLWPVATDDDEAIAFIRKLIVAIAAQAAKQAYQ
ncbi:MAG: LysR family transcriptional regulator [Deltaproteobacteria bacterium]|nr:LysR family transcriptional regulator [Deltaproteobacteria bacterium]